jgi:phosphate transport system protein
MTQWGTGHIMRRFDGELAGLRAGILQMGALVIDQIERAVTALKQEDVAAAQAVIVRDRRVDAANQRIDEELVGVLAKRQPVARDLREVITIAKSVTDLERIGDMARKVARLVVKIYDDTAQTVPNPRMLEDIPYLAGLSAAMLRDSLDAFDRMDMRLALAVVERDQEMEGELEGALRRLVTYLLQDARSVGYAVDTVLVLRAVERMGGHAKNIAESVIYLGTGTDVRFLDFDTLKAEVLTRLD